MSLALNNWALISSMKIIKLKLEFAQFATQML